MARATSRAPTAQRAETCVRTCKMTAKIAALAAALVAPRWTDARDVSPASARSLVRRGARAAAIAASISIAIRKTAASARTLAPLDWFVRLANAKAAVKAHSATAAARA